MKAQGKCTTDHISAAGPWLKYRGHLENISGNLFLGVVNAFTGATGEGKDQLDGSTRSFPDIAKHYGETGTPWCAIGDRNYGEGSSREHAAMEPRFRGGRAIFARSFARIHETNAKKQGLVPLTFADPATYDAIGEDDRINVLGLPPGARPARCAARSSSPTAPRSTSSARTRSATSRWSGSRPARRSTSSAPRSPPTTLPDQDFHKHFRACTLDFAYRNQRWVLSRVPVREIVRARSILLVEIFFPGSVSRGR